MQTSERGIALLKESEGFSATPYICPAGKPTIGYGHVIRDDENFADQGIDDAQAESLLRRDIGTAEQAVFEAVSVGLTQNQFDAMVVLTYNIGIGAFQNSTLLKDLNAGDIDSALSQWGRWIYASGKPLPGLIARRKAEVELFTSQA